MTLAAGVRADDVEVSSVRLNGTVLARRVVSALGRILHLKFDRSDVLGVLPTGHSVEVRVTGTLRGIPFEGVDHVRVGN